MDAIGRHMKKKKKIMKF